MLCGGPYASEVYFWLGQGLELSRLPCYTYIVKYKALVAPHQSLQLLTDDLKLAENDLRVLRSHRDFFIGKKDEFAEFFYEFFYEMPETRIILERFGKPDVMKLTWARWFKRLFRENLDVNFTNYLGTGAFDSKTCPAQELRRDRFRAYPSERDKGFPDA